MSQTITQFFARMNDIDMPYVVLRNFEGLPESAVVGGHGDVDLLVYDLEHWKEIFPEAKAVYQYPRVQFAVPIGTGTLYMDIRHIGDEYYPVDFEKSILETREYNEKGFYTPNPLHFRIALAYHVVHHKNMNTYQRWIGDASIEDLLASLKKSNIGYSIPKDPSVGRFNQYWKGATSVVEKSGDSVTKKQVGYGSYNLTENEYRILSNVSSRHFPKVLTKQKDTITLEDCGIPLSAENLPDDWKEQLVQILLELKMHGIQHRDIKPDNLMMKDGVIKLIDFGWARFDSDKEDNPPSCLGFPYKPSWGYDDNYSMRMVIKRLEYQRDEMCENVACCKERA